MTPERYRQVVAVFEAVAEKSPADRAALLAQACAGDDGLRREVEAMLAADQAPGGILEKPPNDLAAGRRSQVEALYRLALEKGPADRSEFLTQACAGNEDLRREVESLLAFEVAVPRAATVAPGTQLGAYRIETVLGEGGMGVVYRALDTRLNRPVAIKFLSAQVADESARRRFQQEAKTASSLNHPHIVTVHEAGEFEGLQYLVTEFVDGGTLKDWARGNRTWRQVVELLVGVADGLACAHSAGILHRDIKPANILVGKNGYAKLADFGLAKLAQPAGGEPLTRKPAEHDTRAGAILGTIRYMSPEQAAGKPLSPRSDIFSFGIVLYEMLKGRAPFEGPTDLEILEKIRHSAPEPMGPEVPVALRLAVEKALEKDPADRYQTMRDLVVDLRRLIRQIGDSSPSDAPAASGKRRRSWRWGAAIAIAIAMAALAFYALRGHGGGIESIAVLPFSNAGNDPNLEYLSDGLTEELINILSQAPKLRVMARAKTFGYKGRLDPQKAGQELRVDAVLTGRLTQRGDRVIVQADLVNSSDGSQLWGQQYNRSAAELQAIQEEIARQIIDRLRFKLSGEDERKLAKRSVDPQAYDLYLQGRHAIIERTPERVRRSLGFFEQSIARDPSYAAAYAGLADAYSFFGVLEIAPPHGVMPKAKAAALKAMELDPASGEAHTSLGIVKATYEWDWAGAERELQRGVELNPGDAYGQHWLAHYYEFTGRWKDALTQMQRALDLDPLNSMVGSDLGYDLYLNQRYDEAIQRAQKVIPLDPADTYNYIVLALSREQKNLRTESLADLEKARLQSAVFGVNAGTAAGLYCREGKPEAARKLLDYLNDLSKKQYVPAVQLALIYLALGDNEQGFHLLDKAVEERSGSLVFYLSDPAMDSVRRDPRFAALLTKIGLPSSLMTVPRGQPSR